MAKPIQHMPLYYKNSLVGKDITKPIDLENESTIQSIFELVKQFSVNTATYALYRYEEEYGLPINPNIPIEERRSRIKARMRSVGVVNKIMLQNLINSWTHSKVEIIENFTHGNLSFSTHRQLSQYTHRQLTSNDYEVKIVFVDALGVPSNMQGVYDAVNLIKPAHLIFTYSFKYNTVKVLRESNYTVKSLADSSKTVLQIINEKI